jgi:hypothetical protein
MHTSDVGSQSKRPTAWLVCLVVGVLVLIFGKPSEAAAAWVHFRCRLSFDALLLCVFAVACYAAVPSLSRYSSEEPVTRGGIISPSEITNPPNEYR